MVYVATVLVCIVLISFTNFIMLTAVAVYCGFVSSHRVWFIENVVDSITDVYGLCVVYYGFKATDSNDISSLIIVQRVCKQTHVIVVVPIRTTTYY